MLSLALNVMAAEEVASTNRWDVGAEATLGLPLVEVASVQGRAVVIPLLLQLILGMLTYTPRVTSLAYFTNLNVSFT